MKSLNILNKSRVNTVKLKISKLEEKYSKGTLSNNNELLGSSHDSTENVNETFDEEAKVGKSEETHTQSEIKEFNHRSQDKTKGGNNDGHFEFINHAAIDNKQLYDNHSVSMKNSPSIQGNSISSDILTDVSNQFEHICFVSSSSDEPIFVQSINEPKATTSKSETNLLDQDVASLIRNTSYSYKEDDDIYESPICSVVEISSISENNFSVKDENIIKSHVTDIKCENTSYESRNSTERTLENCATKESQSSSEPCKLKSTFSSASAESKATKGHKTKTSGDSIISNMSVGQSIYSNQSNRTFSKLPLNDSFLHGVCHIDYRSKTKAVDVNLKEKHVCKTNSTLMDIKRKSRTEFREHIQKCINSKTSENRPTVKSCKLVKRTEMNEEEFESLVKKANPSYKLDGILHDIMASGSSHDEIIRHLLRSQIQLTRHFIESHHKMYLHCCQAVKLLSEK